MERIMAFQLVVVRAFGAYKKGDTIIDQKEIADILASEHAASVVRVHRGTQNPPKQGS
jgi:hypothetical protein